jgi:DNA-binding protein
MIEWIEFSKNNTGRSLSPYEASITYKVGSTYLLYFGSGTPEINESEFLQVGKISGSVIFHFNNENLGIKLSSKGRKSGKAVSIKSVITFLLKELDIQIKDEMHLSLKLKKISQLTGNIFTIEKQQL